MVVDTAFYDLGGLLSNAVVGASSAPVGKAVIRK
jgi:hypothetical protein